jgi:quercetin dioxygenase-like cupin family protein
MLMPAKAMPFQPWAMFTAFSPPVIKQAGFMRFLKSVSRQTTDRHRTHSHDDEAFFVLEGEVTFQIGREKIVGTPGTFVQGPRGIPDTFKNSGKSAARLLVFVMPSGFENFVKEFAQPVASFDSPAIPVDQKEIDKLLAVAPKYGIEILPPSP